jgi:hypothetical protein
MQMMDNDSNSAAGSSSRGAPVGLGVFGRFGSMFGALALVLAAPAAAAPGDAITAGEIVVEPPTLISLGFEWTVEGDANRNASAAIAYRRKGETQWRTGLPLLRLQAERTVYANTLDYTAPNMFSGSLFDLAENAEYEVRLTLTDPDGASGEVDRIVTARTRAEPQPFAGGRTFHVYPPDFAGQKQEPAFLGLLAAYYADALGGDWSRASPPRVQPGDTVLVHAGVYKDFNRYNYSHEIQSQYKTCCGTPWDGTYYLTRGGTAERPIAIKAAGDGDVVFDGDGNNVLFNVMGADHLYFEGIAFRNTTMAIEAGQKGVAGAQGLTVKHAHFEDVGVGIHSDWSRSRNFYIADNVFVGRNDPNALSGWLRQWPWAGRADFEEKRLLKSYYAVSIYGAGHVVAHNRVTSFHDGIDHATYGMPDGYPSVPRDRMPVSIDFYNNDISNVHDNCFEADGAMRNIRIFRNRCFNTATGGMSPQPIFGGPAYFIRNVVYNGVYGPLKIQANPSGILVYQNTYVGEVAQLTPASNMHFRNNLILGQGARGAVFAIDTLTPYSSSDHNGFYAYEGAISDTGKPAEYAFQWSSPPAGAAPDYVSAREVRRFETLKEYAKATGQDTHSREIDYSVFVNAAAPDFADPTRLYGPDDVDLRLAPRSRAVDAGVVLPGVNDGFAGRAPDLGAYELGAEPPHYGPRAAPASLQRPQ